MPNSAMAKTTLQDTASFIVRLEPTDPQNLKNFVTTNPVREEFWRSTAQIDPDNVDLEIDLCESRFLQTFAARFRDALIARHRTRDGSVEDRGTKPQQLNLPGVKRLRFTIESHEYGSLEAKVLVDGATTIAAAFSGRMDLFAAFVEQYTPQVFVAGLPIDPVSERPVTATILAADDLAKNQFKAVLDELAKRKSAGLGGTPTTQSTNHAPAVASAPMTKHASMRQSVTASEKDAGLTAVHASPLAPATSQQVATSTDSSDLNDTPVEKSAAAEASGRSAPQATPTRSMTASDILDPVAARQDVRPYDDRQQAVPQIIMMPQPYPSSAPDSQQSQTHKNNRLWVVANLSLLFPVLLALLVLYFAYGGLQTERAQLAIQQANIERREKEVQQLMLTREKQLFEALHPGSGQSSAQSASAVTRGAP